MIRATRRASMKIKATAKATFGFFKNLKTEALGLCDGLTFLDDDLGAMASTLCFVTIGEE